MSEQMKRELGTPGSEGLEAELARAIEPWLSHMTWRKDFDSWRARRIWQEKHQEANLKDVAQALGEDLGEGASGKRVLDLGAGMGGLSVALLVTYEGEGLQLQAMDYNPDYAKIASLRAKRYSLDLPIAVAAGEHLPYPNACFDLITCLDVLEHVQDSAMVLREMKRVLKPGGVVLTTVPNRRAFRDPHYHLPFINWLPRWAAEKIIERTGHSKDGGLLQDRQELSELNTYTWAGISKEAHNVGFAIRDQVLWRIEHGEIRQLKGIRKTLLRATQKVGLFGLMYRAHRYGWQGTYQIMLRKPIGDRVIRKT